MLTFRQLFDPQSSTYTYLLADGKTGKAILIDPVFEQAQRDAALVKELGLKLVATLETHVHADHVTGGWLLKRQFGSAIVVAESTAAKGADRYIKHGDKVTFGQRFLITRATPGHTDGCLTFVLDDESKAFTGDCLLIRGSGRTDFQQGDPSQMYRSVHTQIFTLPDHCLLYPGHDYRGLTVTSVAEERKYNPRLGGQIGETDFAGYMNNLNLPHPKQIDRAVPANMRCGQPEGEVDVLDAQDWARLSFSFAGIWEIEPASYEEVSDRIQLVDVREAVEFSGPIGHIRGAILMPLGELGERVGELDRAKPIVTVCRSGARSAQATVMLQKAGFTRVANLAGGMLRWRASGYPVENGSD